MITSRWFRWLMSGGVAGLLFVAPFVYYRYVYTYGKRLREVEPGQVYRSGQMTEPGFRNAVKRYHFRTIVNLQDDNTDPEIARGYFSTATLRESELCRDMGVRYILIAPDLADPRKVPGERPRAIEQFLEIMDNQENYPVLIHCKAGLHRTGCMVAIYRMEYDGWTMEDALAELKGHGFGEFVSTRANEYIHQYVVSYQPGIRKNPARIAATPPAPAAMPVAVPAAIPAAFSPPVASGPKSRVPERVHPVPYIAHEPPLINDQPLITNQEPPLLPAPRHTTQQLPVSR